MSFPESPRVIYGKNPLKHVICQLRFPTILRIAGSDPAEFQELVGRQQYPHYRKRLDRQELLEQQLGRIPESLRSSILITGDPTHEFASEDEAWVIGLNKEFLALSTNSYRTWEDFRLRLSHVLDSLGQVYGPPFFERVGLRYQNLIERSQLGFEHVDWAEMFDEFLVAEFKVDRLKSRIREAATTLLIDLGVEQRLVRIQHGLLHDPENDESDNVVGYLIDNDFYTNQKVYPNDALNLLDDFNRQNGYLFRFCISPKLHALMEPQAVE